MLVELNRRKAPIETKEQTQQQLSKKEMAPHAFDSDQSEAESHDDTRLFIVRVPEGAEKTERKREEKKRKETKETSEPY